MHDRNLYIGGARQRRRRRCRCNSQWPVYLLATKCADITLVRCVSLENFSIMQFIEALVVAHRELLTRYANHSTVGQTETAIETTKANDGLDKCKITSQKSGQFPVRPLSAIDLCNEWRLLRKAPVTHSPVCKIVKSLNLFYGWQLADFIYISFCNWLQQLRIVNQRSITRLKLWWIIAFLVYADYVNRSCYWLQQHH